MTREEMAYLLDEAIKRSTDQTIGANAALRQLQECVRQATEFLRRVPPCACGGGKVLAEGFAQVDADGTIISNYWDDDSYFRVYREQPGEEMPSRRVRILEALPAAGEG